MKCPLLLQQSKPVGQTNFGLRDCPAECQLYDQGTRQCSIKTISASLAGIATSLERIADIADNRP